MGVVGWSIGNGWCTLLVPVMFDKIKEVSPGFFAVRRLRSASGMLTACGLQNALYIFGIANILAIAVVWAFYPETANRTLEGALVRSSSKRSQPLLTFEPCRLHTEIDFLFFSDSWFVWHAEAEYSRLKKELEVTGEVPDDLKTSTHLKEKISLDSAAA
jgi:hypothetical protein